MSAAFCPRCNDEVPLEDGVCPRGHRVDLSRTQTSPLEPEPWSSGADPTSGREPDAPRDGDPSAPVEPGPGRPQSPQQPAEQVPPPAARRIPPHQDETTGAPSPGPAAAGGAQPGGHAPAGPGSSEQDAPAQPGTGRTDHDHDAPAQPDTGGTQPDAPAQPDADADEGLSDVLASLEAVVSRLGDTSTASGTEDAATGGTGDTPDGVEGPGTGDDERPTGSPPAAETVRPHEAEAAEVISDLASSASQPATGGEGARPLAGEDGADGGEDRDVDLNRFTARGDDGGVLSGLLRRLFRREG